MRISRHRPQLLRRKADHCRQKVDIRITVAVGDLAHDVVHEAELVIYQVMNVGRHCEIDADIIAPRMLGELA